MRISIKKTIIFIITFLFVLMFFRTVAFAGETLNPNDYQTTLQYDDATYIFSKGGQVLKLLRNIAAIVSVLTITIIGLRYMMGSVEQKAEYKQTMMPVVVGCILIASLSAILTLIQSVVK